jgi:hypothetical protein
LCGFDRNNRQAVVFINTLTFYETDVAEMGNELATSQIANELSRALSNMSSDLDRVAILSAALVAFVQPVPEYEPTFHYWNAASLHDHELARRSES